MKKLMKPLVFLFAIAVSTGAYAQQERPAHNLKKSVNLKASPAKNVHAKNERKAVVLPKEQAQIKRVMRAKGLETTIRR